MDVVKQDEALEAMAVVFEDHYGRRPDHEEMGRFLRAAAIACLKLGGTMAAFKDASEESAAAVFNEAFRSFDGEAARA